MCYSDEELIEVHSDISGKINDYDILKNVPTIDGVAVHGDITESGKYTDETPTAGSKRLITSGAIRAAMDSELQGPKGEDGADGLSAYDIALQHGFEGTEEEWLSSLNGKDGHTPVKGVDYLTEDDFDSLAEKSLVMSVNGKTGAVKLTAEDVGALPGDTSIPVVPENISAFNNDADYATLENLDDGLSGKSNTNHTHDDRYYTEAETDELISTAQNNAMLLVSDLSFQTEAKLAGKSDKNHNHDDSYYTEAEADGLISKAQENAEDFAQELVNDLETQMEEKFSGKSDTTHTHSFYEITDIPEDLGSGQGQGICLVTATADFENYTFSDISHTFKAIEASFKQGNFVFVMVDIGDFVFGRRVIVPLSSYGASMIMFETVASIDEKTYVITAYQYSDDETSFKMEEIMKISQG